ncbi:trypsin-like peptidase domain-containing protein [Mesorhizobium shangrilense]|uniref:Trypsin-like peptidase domain-containing protein n=1 Tax=Mesorhizobium shangrilense TaxID=460060 RepID=A0ABV2DL96_9HYPH
MIAGKKSFRLFLTASTVIASSLFCAAAGSSDIISSGTGFFVNDQGWIVTNQHVVEGCESVSVPSLGDAAEIKIDKQNDLAVFQVNATDKKPISLRSTQPRLGEDIAAYGFPLNGILSDTIKVTTGNINSLVGMENDTRFMQVSTPLQPGNSGGPIVDHWGSVVGMATSVLGSKFADATGITPQNVNFAIRSNVIELFLQSRDIKFESSVPQTGAPPLSTADLSDKVVPSTVPVLCHGKPMAQVANQAPTTAPVAPTTTVSPPMSRGFQSLTNVDVIGFDYSTLRSVSSEQCSAACQADSSCRATTYNKKEHFCFLKNDAKLLVRNYDADANVASDLLGSTVVSTFTIASGRDMAGGDYLRLRSSSFIGCYLECEKDWKCKAFAYTRKKNDCWLKDQTGRLSVKAGVDLGVR